MLGSSHCLGHLRRLPLPGWTLQPCAQVGVACTRRGMSGCFMNIASPSILTPAHLCPWCTKPWSEVTPLGYCWRYRSRASILPGWMTTHHSLSLVSQQRAWPKGMRQRRESLHKEGTKPNITAGHEALTKEDSSSHDCAKGLGAWEGAPELAASWQKGAVRGGCGKYLSGAEDLRSSRVWPQVVKEEPAFQRLQTRNQPFPLQLEHMLEAVHFDTKTA